MKTGCGQSRNTKPAAFERGHSMAKKKIALIAVIVTILLIFFCPFAYLAPYKGKVIDADSKEPVKGAVVLVVYYGTAYTVAGSNSYEVDAREVLTDSNGEFMLPRKIVWFRKAKWFPEATVTIIKPGYGSFPRHKDSAAPGFNASWPPPKVYIVYEIPKLNTIEERKKNITSIDSCHDIPYQKRKLYFQTINKELENVGVSLYPVPEE